MRSLACLAVAATLLLPVTGLASADPADAPVPVGRFSAGDLTGWKPETIWGAKKSNYELVKARGTTVLKGTAVGSASGLLHRIDLDPKAAPIISWSWKIDRTVRNGNERTKAGHDFAARLYVVFPRGFFSRTRAIEYVWGNVMARGEQLASPYSKNAVMIAVDAGNESVGTWVYHNRNIIDDYRACFGEDPPRIGAIALMTDGDNTGDTVTGYYGDIVLSSGSNGTGARNKTAPPPQPRDIGTAKEEQKDNRPAGTPAGTAEPRPPQHTPPAPATPPTTPSPAPVAPTTAPAGEQPVRSTAPGSAEPSGPAPAPVQR